MNRSPALESDCIFEPRSRLNTAVLLLGFNRPEATKRVFAAIRQAQPPRLYIALDGPRTGAPDDDAKCAAVATAVSCVDWRCDVTTLRRENNLGCKAAVSSAISWFFEHEEQGIILEDDCVPSQSFFWFCEELLDKYRDDERVWQICGSAFLADTVPSKDKASYRFSRYGPVWGWASWRRAWMWYDPNLERWPEMREELCLSSAFTAVAERNAKRRLGDRLYQGEIDTWDYQWGFAKNFNHGLSIVPAVNLVRNIGFDATATHTTRIDRRAPQVLFELSFPLRDPTFVLPDARHDQAYCATFIETGGRMRATIIGLARQIFQRRSK